MYVTERWLGGLLTNFQTVKKQIRRLKELEAGSEEGGEFENYTKKEQLLLSRERDKLAKNLAGIKNMTRLPGLMFVIDSKKERIAVNEANKLGIPIVAIVDTNADPDLITVPIAGNDDAIRSVELITKAIADAIAEARLAKRPCARTRRKASSTRTAPTAAPSRRTMATRAGVAGRVAVARSRKRSPRASRPVAKHPRARRRPTAETTPSSDDMTISRNRISGDSAVPAG